MSRFFEGFLAGAIIGAAAGLLMAPQSGEETRNRLRELKDENEELITTTKDTTENLIEKTKDAIEQGFEKLGDMIEAKKDATPIGDVKVAQK